MNKIFFSVMLFAAMLVSCGKNDGNTIKLSSGLKIFVTASTHNGDFDNDTTLQGATGIDKADFFCNKDLNKPNSSTYKALIVDGVNRDAATRINWVLAPNTKYYRSYNDVEIGVTTNDAIFTIPLTNSIADAPSSPSNAAWTGIADISNYSANSSLNCGNWADRNSHSVIGFIFERSSYAFTQPSTVMYGCGGTFFLYCVEQP